MAEVIRILGTERLTTVNVLYFLPEYDSILQQFIWQTLDIPPRYPRVEKFVDYWEREIDAIIQDIIVSVDLEKSVSEFRAYPEDRIINR